MYDDIVYFEHELSRLGGRDVEGLEGGEDPAHWKLDINYQSKPVDFVFSLCWMWSAESLDKRTKRRTRSLLDVITDVSLLFCDENYQLMPQH